MAHHAEEHKHNRNGTGCGKFYGVGIGPGDPELLTRKAVKVLQQVDVVFHVAGPRSRESISGGVVDALPECCGAERLELVFSMSPQPAEREEAWEQHAQTVASRLQQGYDCAFVTLGDPLIYSTYGYLLRKLRGILPELQVETVPGITSFQLAAARKHMPLAEDRDVLAVVPAASHIINEQTASLDAADALVLLKTYKSRQNALDMLKKHGITEGIYAARVGLTGEFVADDLTQLSDYPDDYLSMLIVKRDKGE